MIKKVSLLVALAVALGTTSCGSKKNTFQGSEAPQIAVANPATRDLQYHVEYPGYLQSKQKVEIVARVSGYLEKICFTPGKMVKEGQLLFVIEPRTYEDKVEIAKANLETAKAQLDLAEIALNRVTEAAKSNAVSEMDVLKAKTDVDKAKASVSSAKADLRTAQTNLDYCYIKAPISGEISKSLVDKGNYVNALSGVLASLYQNDELYVNFSIEDSKYLAILQNDAQKNPDFNLKNIEIYVGSENPTMYKGTLEYFAPNIHLATGSMDMRAIVDNKKGDLTDGLYVKVSLPFYVEKNAMIVPEEAIGTDQTGRFVYVVNDSNMLEYRSIKVGMLDSDNMREVESGITTKDLIVVNGLMKARDGLKIVPVKETLNVSTKSPKPEENGDAMNPETDKKQGNEKVKTVSKDK